MAKVQYAVPNAYLEVSTEEAYNAWNNLTRALGQHTHKITVKYEHYKILQGMSVMRGGDDNIYEQIMALLEKHDYVVIELINE